MTSQQRRASEAAKQYCRHLNESTDAYRNCYEQTYFRLEGIVLRPRASTGEGPTTVPLVPQVQPPTQVANPCDPFVLANGVRAVSPAGTEPAVILMAVKDMQRLMGCR